jgi:hypothetical protein
VKWVQQVHRVIRVYKVLLARRVILVLKERLAQQVLRGNKV